MPVSTAGLYRVARCILFCLILAVGVGCGDEPGEGEQNQQSENQQEANAEDNEAEENTTADNESESSCPDGYDPVDGESSCPDDAECINPEDELWCAASGDDSPVLVGPDEPLETDQNTPLTFTVDGEPGTGGGELTAEVVGDPGHGTIEPTSGTVPLELTYTPETDFYGDDGVELVGTDSDDDTTEPLELSIQVHQVNTPPEISSIPDQTVEPSGTTGPLELTVSDAETSADELDVTAESMDTGILSQQQVSVGGSAETRTVEVEAGENYGTAAVEVTVSDGDLSASTQFEVELIEFCPLMTYDCAAGCCPTESHVVSEQRGSYADLDIDDEDNVYITFAIPSSTAWGTGLTTYTAETGEWEFSSYGSGNSNAVIEVAESGRVHHTYGRDQGSVYYQYSDDQGDTWTSLDDIPGSLDIGGTCSLGVDAGDDPHLLCGMDESYGSEGIPRYIEWDGDGWDSGLTNLDAIVRRHTIMHLGYNDRPHVVHTYGPTDNDMHYSYRTDQWVTEAVPIPEEYRVATPDRIPGFVLAEDDVVHVAFGGRSNDSIEYQVWYGVRTIDDDTGEPEWDVQKVISYEEMAENEAPNVSMDLDENGDPVIFTDLGTGVFRDDEGAWHVLQTDREINDVAVHNGQAYIVFPVEGESYYAQRLHLSLLELTAESE